MSVKTYFDYDFRGTIENSGALKEYTGSEAVANAVRSWMASFKGEVLRRPNLGGPIVNLLMKPMSDTVAATMEEEIVVQLRTEFTPRIIITSSKVVPNYEGDYYEITISGYCPSVKDVISFTESLNVL